MNSMEKTSFLLVIDALLWNRLDKMIRDCNATYEKGHMNEISGPFEDVVIVSSQYSAEMFDECVHEVEKIASSDTYNAVADETLRVALVKDKRLGMNVFSTDISSAARGLLIQRYVNNFFEMRFLETLNVRMGDNSFYGGSKSCFSEIYFRRSSSYFCFDEMVNTVKQYLKADYEHYALMHNNTNGWCIVLERNRGLNKALTEFPTKGFLVDEVVLKAASELGYVVSTSFNKLIVRE